MRSNCLNVLISVVGLMCLDLRCGHAAPPESATLLGMLAEWKYPGSEFHGAEMSDGGSRRLQSVKCKAVLTTADPVEKVEKYYVEKFPSGPQDVASPDTVVAQTVSTQDDSTGRPLQLRVIVVNRATTSTTLVISRSEGEKRTHIAWSHYLRFDRQK
jgi:hypothetical protein